MYHYISKKQRKDFFFQICGESEDVFWRSVEFCAHGGASLATLSALKELLLSERKTKKEQLPSPFMSICNKKGEKISIFLERDWDIVFSASQELIFIANKELKENQKQQLFQILEAMKKDTKIF